MRIPTNAATTAVVVATDAPETSDASSLLATTGKPAADTPSSSTTAPTAGDRPARGGSYILQEDGTLLLREETKEPSLIERVAAEAGEKKDASNA